MTFPESLGLAPEIASRPFAPAAAKVPDTLPNTPTDQKLRKAAAEFESILLSSLWKSMTDSFASADDSTDPAHDTLSDLGMQSMCSAVGKAGGLGVGKLILKHLEPLLADSQNGNGARTNKAFAPPADNSQ